MAMSASAKLVGQLRPSELPPNEGVVTKEPALRRKGEIAEELGMAYSAINYEAQPVTLGTRQADKMLVSKRWVSETTLGIGATKIGPVEKAHLINSRHPRAAKIIARATPRPVDDPIIVQRHERCLRVDEMAAMGMTDPMNVDQWKTTVLVPGEVEMATIECCSFRNVLEPGDKVGNGIMMLTKLNLESSAIKSDLEAPAAMKHRIHFIMDEVGAKFEASEADVRGGCLMSIFGMNGHNDYESTHDRKTFVSALTVEDNIFHAAAMRLEKSTTSRKVLFESESSCCMCCAGPKITDEDIMREMNRRNTCCPDDGSCCDGWCCNAALDYWFGHASYGIKERFEEAIANLNEDEGTTQSLLGRKQLLTQNLDASLVSTVAGMHLVVRSPATNKVEGAFVGFQSQVPDHTIGKFVSMLQAFTVPAPPVDKNAKEITWELAIPMSLTSGPDGAVGFAGRLFAGGFSMGRKHKKCIRYVICILIVIILVAIIVPIISASSDGDSGYGNIYNNYGY